jgi:hypothetical protein
MPWSQLPDPAPPMPPTERLQAIVARLGCLGVTGLLVAAALVGFAGRGWI